MNNRPNFSEIEPLLAERQVDKEHDTVHCVFVCPITHRRVTASSYIQQGQRFQDRLMDSASRSFWYELRTMIARTVCSFFPQGFLREVVEGTAWRMSYGSGDDKVDSGRELDQATVDAFLSVRDDFEHDGGGWRAKEVVREFVTDFERQLKDAPIATRYEVETAARALAYLSSLDGVDHSDRDFLANFAPGTVVGVGAPSAVELSELSPLSKPSVYMLACALALTDQTESSQEREYLAQLEHDLDLSVEQAAELRKAAGQFIVEQSIDVESHPNPQQLKELAKLAGVTVPEVERVLVRRRKRTA